VAKWRLLKFGRLSSLASIVPGGVESAVEAVQVDVVVQ
jgi:hypothetical protein